MPDEFSKAYGKFIVVSILLTAIALLLSFGSVFFLAKFLGAFGVILAPIIVIVGVLGGYYFLVVRSGLYSNFIKVTARTFANSAAEQQKQYKEFLKQQLREELKQELKEEIRKEMEQEKEKTGIESIKIEGSASKENTI